MNDVVVILPMPWRRSAATAALRPASSGTWQGWNGRCGAGRSPRGAGKGTPAASYAGCWRYCRRISTAGGEQLDHERARAERAEKRADDERARAEQLQGRLDALHARRWWHWRRKP